MQLVQYLCFVVLYFDSYFDINKSFFVFRYFYDGLKRQRFIKLMVKDEKGNLIVCIWEEVLVEVVQKLFQVKGNEIVVVVGGFVDVEVLVVLKDLFNRFDSEGLYIEEGFLLDGVG